MFGGNANLTPALTYARAHGGGVVAVSSQNGAGQTITTGSGTDLAAIGGFSGRESQVSVAWLADAVESGRIRWVLTESSSGGRPQDSRVGSQEVMAWPRRSARPSAASTDCTTCRASRRSCARPG